MCTRHVALLELPKELFMEVVNAREEDSRYHNTYVVKVEEIHVSHDLQALSGPPMTLYSALPDAVLLEVRPSHCQGMVELLIESPALRAVPEGFQIPKIQFTHGKARYRGKIRSSNSF